MINCAIIMGRLTSDPELKTTPSGVSVTTFSVAVERNYAPQGQERQTDFINVVAWRQTAEFVTKWFRKGQMIAVQGSIQTAKETNGQPSRSWPTRSASLDPKRNPEPRELRKNTRRRPSRSRPLRRTTSQTSTLMTNFPFRQCKKPGHQNLINSLNNLFSPCVVQTSPSVYILR